MGRLDLPDKWRDEDDPPEVPRVPQPPGEPTCGQVALAVLSGRTLEESCAAVGHRRATRTRELLRAMPELGLAPLAGRLDSHAARPRFGLAKLVGRRVWGWHWLAVVDFELVDGHAPPLAGRVTSYLPVERVAA